MSCGGGCQFLRVNDRTRTSRGESNETIRSGDTRQTMTENAKDIVERSTTTFSASASPSVETRNTTDTVKEDEVIVARFKVRLDARTTIGSGPGALCP